jgi:4-hydroxybenzoate polyprenyltransferase/phosphoserine phosphatase
MSTLNPKLPLFVDLDGTVIKTDLMFESILQLFKKNPLAIFLIPLWLLKGRAYLKHQLAQRVEIAVDLLPLNTEFIAYLRTQAAEGRDIILISASNQLPVRQVSDHLSLFIDAIGSDADHNLKSENKLRRIQALISKSSFAYAGNSSADLSVWIAAEEVLMVNCTAALESQLGDKTKTVTLFDPTPAFLAKFWQAMRPHQWLKNGLIFLPLILSHQIDQAGLALQAVIGFISFSLCASSVYMLNDLLDLNNDRQHHSKYSRPFASGELSLGYGFLGAPVLLFAAILVALLLPPEFLSVLLIYWLLTCAYSLLLKKIFLADVLVLAVLYTLRIVAGSAAISVVTTNWLFAFSMSLFLGLAIIKRYTELSILQTLGKTTSEGRAYSTRHLKFLSVLGAGASLAAVLVFTFYINAPDITRLYSTPAILWLICPLLLYLLGRIWLLAYRGKLNEDPVLFAITDRRSQLITLMCGLMIWIAI